MSYRETSNRGNKHLVTTMPDGYDDILFTQELLNQRLAEIAAQRLAEMAAQDENRSKNSAVSNGRGN